MLGRLRPSDVCLGKTSLISANDNARSIDVLCGATVRLSLGDQRDRLVLRAPLGAARPTPSRVVARKVD